MGTVLVVGGGAAGMMAAIQAGRKGNEVFLFEQNEKLGKKLFITGKGRCNVTNGCDTEEFFEHVVSNPKFLYSAVYGFSNFDVLNFFEKAGLSLKTERGNRVFPSSDKSSDVIKALTEQLNQAGVHIMLNNRVCELLKSEDGMEGVVVEDAAGKKKTWKGNAVILATGGISYASTGATGDGFHFAKQMGHKLTPCIPSLVALETEEDDVKGMQGLSLKNVELTLLLKGKSVSLERGEMLFTHFGISGPLVLTASTKLPGFIRKERLSSGAMENVCAILDLKPALSKEQLDARLLREFEENKNKELKNVFQKLLPQKMIPVVLKRSSISPDKKVNTVTKEERMTLITTMKQFSMKITGLRGFQEAIITSGGVSVSGVNPSSMESKIVKGLYFAGEVLDVDAVTGGYNLQIAWSTGYLAGDSVS